HFHTHDTSGISAASVLAAVEAGCDAVDGALDSMSGLTAQPNLGAIAASLAGGDRDPQVDLDALQQLSNYWEGVRRYYAPFEADIRSGTADVYRHEMPGGQYTNLREQARGLGLEQRWPEVSKAYAEVNRLFGDIVKVTPTSKVVGDLALFMVGNNLSAEQVQDPATAIDFPASVVSLMRGELGLPPEGFPQALQEKVLKGQKPLQDRPGASLPPVDLEKTRSETEQALGEKLSDTDLASHLMYPKVFRDFVEHRKAYGDVSALPTTAFFYGLREREEISVDIERGKTLVIRLQGSSEVKEEGIAKLFYELNGQPRMVRIPLADTSGAKAGRPKADAGNAAHIGAPMPGMVVRIAVQKGNHVVKGEPLLALEAMKMETVIAAPRAGVIKEILVHAGLTVSARDLLLVIEAD
ncbi:MAG: biotin/lipoyl-containing protein, partial [Stenotrophobium sp.]